MNVEVRFRIHIGEKCTMEEEILDFFCYDEALFPAIRCPSCDIGRLICLDGDEHHICDVCDLEFVVTEAK
jgi:hypothetical protein